MNDAAKKETLFPAKLLLFGEYTVLLNGQALAIPYPKFNGRWSKSEQIDERLLSFGHFLEEHSLKEAIDSQQFICDIQEQLMFKSTIPVGYGLGSSGALCAAVYHRYAKQKSDDLTTLRSIFSKMESHFHGKSSGVDPLVAYCQKALWIQQDNWQLLHDFDAVSTKKVHFFLLDTGQTRQTNYLVNWFLEQKEKETYRKAMETEICPLIDSLIQTLIQKKYASLLPLFHQLGDYQWQYFRPMIPDFLQTTYLAALNSDWYKLKLCGAGGGGFFLGITTDPERLNKELNFKLLAVD